MTIQFKKLLIKQLRYAAQLLITLVLRRRHEKERD